MQEVSLDIALKHGDPFRVTINGWTEEDSGVPNGVLTYTFDETDLGSDVHREVFLLLRPFFADLRYLFRMSPLTPVVEADRGGEIVWGGRDFFS